MTNALKMEKVYFLINKTIRNKDDVNIYVLLNKFEYMYIKYIHL